MSARYDNNTSIKQRSHSLGYKNFQEFPGPNPFQDFLGLEIFKKEIQDFPGGMGTLTQHSHENNF